MNAEPEPDWVVYRHDMPRHLWRADLEGAWCDRSTVPRTEGKPSGQHEAEAIPTGKFEVSDDGRVAEIYEIRLTDAGKRRLLGADNA